MKTEKPIPEKPAVGLTGGYVQALIPMSDFVLQEYAKLNPYYYQENKVLSKIHDYAKFLKKPLTIGMFVPCDLEGLILEKPSAEAYENCLDNVIYREALSRVIFGSFELTTKFCFETPYRYVENGKIKVFYFSIESGKYELETDFSIVEDLIPYYLCAKFAACT